MGATTNRKKTDTDHGTSQFGSGKKLAAVAALNLGLKIYLTSHDALGPFFYTYGSATDHTMGEPQELLALRAKDGSDLMTEISMHCAKNWGDPIGDDPVKEYHVFREYVQDAYTLDPESYSIQEMNILYPAVKGSTSVYITHTEGFAHILKHPERYLKYLSDMPPTFSLGGVGDIYPKSEKGMTRIFGRGQLASCSKSLSESSVYDYSLAKLSLMSEDRTFRSMYRVKYQLGKLLSSITSVEMAKALIVEIMASRGQLESASLQTLPSSPIPAGAKIWAEAWASFSSDKEVVMSCFDHMKDEYVRHSCGKHVVKIHDPGLQKILRFGGVKYASAYYPDHKKNAKIVVPTPERKKVLDKTLHILGRYGFLHPEFKTHVYRPIVEKKGDNPDLGFCISKGSGKGTYILERMTDAVRDAIETGYHEHAHARTNGALDGSRKFDDRKDTDMGRMLLIAEQLFEMLKSAGVSEEEILIELNDLIQEEDEIVLELRDEDLLEITDQEIDDFFDEEVTNPGPFSPETQKALDLIQKAVDEKKPSE